MLSKYNCQGLNDYTNALREILQEVALLGLWRGKFFAKAEIGMTLFGMLQIILNCIYSTSSNGCVKPVTGRVTHP